MTGSDLSGYDSILKTNLGYHSAGLSVCPFYDLTATIAGNNLHNNARGIDGVGSWHTYSYPASVTISGTALSTSANLFAVGQMLKGSNTFIGNTDGNIALALDQNDNYIDSTSGIEYGPSAYCDTFLKGESTNSSSATLSFDTSAWAKSLIRNAKSFAMEVSEDNGATWKAASTTETLKASSSAVTVNLASSKTYLLRAVLTITARTMPYGSDTDVYTDADIVCYSNAVSMTTTASGGSSTKASTPSKTEGATVIVNEKDQTAGTVTTVTSSDGRTTAVVTVDSGKLETILSSEQKGATVTIPVTGSSDAAAGVLTGEMVKNMESKEATLVVKTDAATYTLPASEIKIDSVSKELGTNVSLKDIAVTVSIAEPTNKMAQVVENVAKDGGFTLMVPAVDYTVTCTYGGRTVNVSGFNSYVERTVAIPDGVDPNKITTGVVVDSDGSVHHVPTKVTVIGGKYFAVINSLTNSTYSVIWNPIEFSDAAKHWAKASINNMGSRMVVTGVGADQYEPNRNMTRAEFAAVMVRALGLEPETGASTFGDVAVSKWYCGYIKTASSYGIINGYTGTAFGPNDTITREQAMAMIARAMKITGLEASLTDSEAASLIAAYADGKNVSQYAGNSIAACLKTQIVSGRENSTLAPKAYVTRAEVAAMVERLLQKSKLI